MLASVLLMRVLIFWAPPEGEGGGRGEPFDDVRGVGGGGRPGIFTERVTPTF